MYCCQNCLDPFEIVWYVAFRNTGTFKSTLWENQDDCFFASALEWQECGGRADVVSGVGLRTGTASLFSDKRAETADLVVCFGAETAVAKCSSSPSCSLVVLGFGVFFDKPVLHSV
jgi:hypothetical protein